MVDLIFNNDLTWAFLQLVFWSFFALPLIGAAVIWLAPEQAGRVDALAEAVSMRIDAFNERLGWIAMVGALLLVLIQMIVVILRYVFLLGLVELQELIIYVHAGLFMVAGGFALAREAHVRVDVFYRPASRRRKALIDVVGVYLLLLPSMALLFYVAWPYVGASWAVLEQSKEASGLPVYPLKTLLLLFPVAVMLQGWVVAARGMRLLLERGHVPAAEGRP